MEMVNKFCFYSASLLIFLSAACAKDEKKKTTPVTASVTEVSHSGLQNTATTKTQLSSSLSSSTASLNAAMGSLAIGDVQTALQLNPDTILKLEDEVEFNLPDSYAQGDDCTELLSFIKNYTEMSIEGLTSMESYLSSIKEDLQPETNYMGMEVTDLLSGDNGVYAYHVRISATQEMKTSGTYMNVETAAGTTTNKYFGKFAIEMYHSNQKISAATKFTTDKSNKTAETSYAGEFDNTKIEMKSNFSTDTASPSLEWIISAVDTVEGTWTSSLAYRKDTTDTSKMRIIMSEQKSNEGAKSFNILLDVSESGICTVAE